MNRRLKRVVIKEELVELTGDFTKAVILNQFIYWSERVRDFDSFIKEEKKRLSKNQEEPKIEKQHGWIYKNADELSEEVMLGVTSKTMRKHIGFLVDNGWVDQRNNPKYKWDRTLQYRVNIYKIQKDLYKIGYSLEGYSLKFEETATPRNENKSKMEAEEVYVRSGRKSSAIPEITTEITTEKNHSPAKAELIPFKEIIEYLNEQTGKNYSHTAKGNKKFISARWNEGFRLDDFKQVIDNKVKDWLNNKEMNQYLRPQTLFNNKFDMYLNQYVKPAKTREKPKHSVGYDDIENMLGGGNS